MSSSSSPSLLSLWLSSPPLPAQEVDYLGLHVSNQNDVASIDIDDYNDVDVNVDIDDEAANIVVIDDDAPAPVVAAVDEDDAETRKELRRLLKRQRRLKRKKRTKRLKRLKRQFVDDEASSTSDDDGGGDDDTDKKRSVPKYKRLRKASDAALRGDGDGDDDAVDDDGNLADFVVPDDEDDYDGDGDDDGGDDDETDDGGNFSDTAEPKVDDDDDKKKKRKRAHSSSSNKTVVVGEHFSFEARQFTDGMWRVYVVAFAHLYRRLSGRACSVTNRASDDLSHIATALSVAYGENSDLSARFAHAKDAYERFYRNRLYWTRCENARWQHIELYDVLKQFLRIRCMPHAAGVDFMEPVYVDVGADGKKCMHRRWLPRYILNGDELSDEDDDDGNKRLSTALPSEQCAACRSRRRCPLIVVLSRHSATSAASATSEPTVHASEAVFPCTEKCYQQLRLYHRTYHHETTSTTMRLFSFLNNTSLREFQTQSASPSVIDYERVSALAAMFAMTHTELAAVGDRHWTHLSEETTAAAFDDAEAVARHRPMVDELIASDDADADADADDAAKDR